MRKSLYGYTSGCGGGFCEKAFELMILLKFRDMLNIVRIVEIVFRFADRRAFKYSIVKTSGEIYKIFRLLSIILNGVSRFFCVI